MAGLIFYSLAVTFSNCSLEVTCNGFPIVRAAPHATVTYQYAINPYLVEKGNELRFRVMPLPGETTPGNTDITASIKTFEKGQIVTPEDGQPVELTAAAGPRAGRAFKIIHLAECLDHAPGSRYHTEASFTFDNQIHNFKSLFREAPVITNVDEVLRYGLAIRKFFEAHDTNQIQLELSPKIRDFAKAAFEEEPKMRSAMMGSINQNFFTAQLESDWEPKDLEAVPWCDKRVYEVSIKPGRHLIKTKPDKEGTTFEMRIFVAKVNGVFRIVR
jgi:hypothetical protein